MPFILWRNESFAVFSPPVDSNLQTPTEKLPCKTFLDSSGQPLVEVKRESLSQQSSCVIWAFLGVDSSCITGCLLTLPAMLISLRVFKHNSTSHGHLSSTVQSFAWDNSLGGGTLTYEINFCKIKISPSFCHCHFDFFFTSTLPCFCEVEQSTEVEACSNPTLAKQIYVAVSAYLNVIAHGCPEQIIWGTYKLFQFLFATTDHVSDGSWY